MAAPVSSTAIEALRQPILDILRRSDLSSISAKKVRIALTQLPDTREAGKTLLGRLQIRLEDKSTKSQVDELIRDCFDTVNSAPAATGNGHSAAQTQSNGYASAAPAAVPRIALPGLGGIPGSHAPSPHPPPSSSGSTAAAPIASSSGGGAKRSRQKEDVISDEEVDLDANAVKRSSTGKKVIKKRKSGTAENGEAKAPNPNNPFNRPVILSDALSRVCGGREMPRYMITKQLWAYIKERDLQNPNNKRQILCDPTLTSLFGKAAVDSFEMAKLISQHVTKKDA